MDFPDLSFAIVQGGCQLLFAAQADRGIAGFLGELSQNLHLTDAGNQNTLEIHRVYNLADVAPDSQGDRIPTLGLAVVLISSVVVPYRETLFKALD